MYSTGTSLRYMAHWRGALQGEREKERWIWMSGWKAAERGTDTRRQRILLGKLLRWHTLLSLSLSQRSIPPLPIPYSTLMSEPCSLLRLHICAAHTHTHTRRLLGRRPRRPFPPSLSALSLPQRGEIAPELPPLYAKDPSGLQADALEAGPEPPPIRGPSRREPGVESFF